MATRPTPTPKRSDVVSPPKSRGGLRGKSDGLDYRRGHLLAAKHSGSIGRLQHRSDGRLDESGVGREEYDDTLGVDAPVAADDEPEANVPWDLLRTQGGGVDRLRPSYVLAGWEGVDGVMWDACRSDGQFQTLWAYCTALGDKDLRAGAQRRTKRNGCLLYTSPSPRD